MWELDCEESWALKNFWCFWTVVLEKTPESPLDCKEIQRVHSEGDQPWDFFGRNDAKAETPVLWPRHAKSWLIGKDSDPGRDWGQEEKGTTQDEMAEDTTNYLTLVRVHGFCLLPNILVILRWPQKTVRFFLLQWQWKETVSRDFVFLILTTNTIKPKEDVVTWHNST